MEVELAEILGMHAGDGYLRKGNNEFEMSGDVEEKEYYDTQVIPLFKKYFKIDIKGKHFPTKGTYGFSKSHDNIKKTLLKAGFPQGAKSTTVRAPREILLTKEKNIRRAFLRGVFDTDGCVRFDKCTKLADPFKKNFHTYPRILHSTVSKEFHEDLKLLLKKEGYRYCAHERPSKKITENNRFVLQISGNKMCEKWFTEIQPRNPVKSSRHKILNLYGFCPTRTTYEERRKVLKGEINPYDYYVGP